MIIKNALITGEIRNIVIESGKIISFPETVKNEDFDLHGNMLIPGLIDIHTHGIGGIDTMDADVGALAKNYADAGTTSVLPTTVTMDYSDLRRVATQDINTEGANIIGFHFEGPYINPKYKGAQNEKYIIPPDYEGFKSFPNVKMVSMAPELPGSMDFIEKVSPDTVVCLGHTDCDYETALCAIDKGASCLTHMYNAMPPLHHRNPGPIGAAIDKNIYAQIICDGVHIAKSVVKAAYRTFSSDRLILISDSMCAAACPDGEYSLGGLPVVVKDFAARLHDGTLAGSVSTLWHCVKVAESFGIPFYDAVKMASETPARLLGLKKGRIDIGYDADLLILDEHKEIEHVIIGGKLWR